MYALNTSEYEAWSGVANPSLRFWLKAWIDGLDAATNVHWALSPISLLTLAYLWQFFDLQGERFIRRQHTSIKLLSHCLPLCPELHDSLPEAREADEVWGGFFSRQIDDHERVRQRVFEYHLNRLGRQTDFVKARDALSALFAVLTLDGYSTDQLFRAVGNRVLHPGDARLGVTCEERLVNLIKSWQSSPPATYIAYTRLVSTEPLSNTLKRKWSAFSYESVDQIERVGTFAVLVGRRGGEQPFVVSRMSCVGGAPEAHRRAARGVFAARLQRNPDLSCLVFPDRSFFKRAEADAPENYYDVGFERIGLALGRLPNKTGVQFFHGAARDLFDAPEEAIRNLMVGAEIRWRGDDVSQTDDVLAYAYRWHLRRALGREVGNYIARVRSIATKTPRPDLRLLQLIGEWGYGWDWNDLLGRTTREASGVDVAFETRLREIVRWEHEGPRHADCMSGPPCTFAEIHNLLPLVRGIRNSATHFGAPPQNLYGVMLYLAKLAFRSCAAACARDAAALTPETSN